MRRELRDPDVSADPEAGAVRGSLCGAFDDDAEARFGSDIGCVTEAGEQGRLRELRE